MLAARSSYDRPTSLKVLDFLDNTSSAACQTALNYTLDLVEVLLVLRDSYHLLVVRKQNLSTSFAAQTIRSAPILPLQPQKLQLQCPCPRRMRVKKTMVHSCRYLPGSRLNCSIQLTLR